MNQFKEQEEKIPDIYQHCYMATYLKAECGREAMEDGREMGGIMRWKGEQWHSTQCGLELEDQNREMGEECSSAQGQEEKWGSRWGGIQGIVHGSADTFYYHAEFPTNAVDFEP